jgi:hypothetical protein
MKAAVAQSLLDEQKRVGRVRKAQPESRSVAAALKRSVDELKERERVIEEHRSRVDQTVLQTWGTRALWDGPWIHKDGPCQFDSLAYQLYAAEGGSDEKWTASASIRDSRSLALRKRYGLTVSVLTSSIDQYVCVVNGVF